MNEWAGGKWDNILYFYYYYYANMQYYIEYTIRIIIEYEHNMMVLMVNDYFFKTL